jgi:hypothetical protein
VSLSDTQICSKTLVALGQNPIADISDKSVPNAVKCNAVYASERDALLREFDWNFARGYARLPMAKAPDFGWLFRFQLPSDFLAAREVNDEIVVPGMARRWSLAGQYILTNDSACNLVYTRQILETGLFDPLFVDCLVYRIARAIAYSITKKESAAQAMHAMYQSIVPTAKRVDSSEQSAKEQDQSHNSSWLQGRGGGSYDGWRR